MRKTELVVWKDGLTCSFLHLACIHGGVSQYRNWLVLEEGGVQACAEGPSFGVGDYRSHCQHFVLVTRLGRVLTFMMLRGLQGFLSQSKRWRFTIDDWGKEFCIYDEYFLDFPLLSDVEVRPRSGDVAMTG